MATVMQWVSANLPVIGVVAGVIVPAIIFLYCENREVTTIRKRY